MNAQVIDFTSERLRRRIPSDQKLITRYGGGETLEGYLNTAWGLPSHQSWYPGNPILSIKCETWDAPFELPAFKVVYDKRSGVARVAPQTPTDEFELYFEFWLTDHQWYFLGHRSSPAEVVDL